MGLTFFLVIVLIVASTPPRTELDCETDDRLTGYQDFEDKKGNRNALVSGDGQMSGSGSSNFGIFFTLGEKNVFLFIF